MDSQTSELLQPRFLVGIDLGTTNSAACYIDTGSPDNAPFRPLHTLTVPQLVAPGTVESLETLPSFHYQPAAGEWTKGSLRLPWQQNDPIAITGVMARECGLQTPGRGIESAKSWLCHPGVDRTAPLLPWHASEDAQRFSPVEISAAYLDHIRQAWDQQFPEHPLAEQDVVITLPASFDEVARELTIQAARQAGLPRVVLIEEPQAAFYAWIQRHQQDWEDRVSPGQKILVCDIGGGTTDFTLIRVRKQPTGAVQFHRVAVGDHLILGGDNLDLALARIAEQQLGTQAQLDPRQWNTLIRLCRHAKEVLLGDNTPAQWTLSIPSRGSRLIAAAIHVELNQQQVAQELMNGFFPRVSLTERTASARSGFREFGLPYASDPAVTRHLAQFLWDHRFAGSDHHPPLPAADDVRSSDPISQDDLLAARPDVVLFNGGVFLSPLVQHAIVDQLQAWFRPLDADWSPLILENERHDLAVARGAAYYGLVRRGLGVRIAAGLPRTYYVGVETESPGTDSQSSPEPVAICLLPAGTESGQTITLDQHLFELTVAEPVEFPLYYSSTRLTDQPADVIAVDRNQLSALPPIRTVLRQRKSQQGQLIQVKLNAALSEIGTLQLWCSQVHGPATWQLQFDIRGATQTDREGHRGEGETQGIVDDALVQAAQGLLSATFGTAGESPGSLPKRLSDVLELSREHWPPTLLRTLANTLFDLESGRLRSAAHEARWLNLLGFCLRPGFGVALDDWRVAETWKLLRGKLLHPGSQLLAEWWILWRRLAGGLNAGQQQALAGPLLSGLKDQRRKRVSAVRNEKRGSAPTRSPSQEELESWRLLGSLELLPTNTKLELGRIILDLLAESSAENLQSTLLWALGRIGSRVPFYGPLNTVLPIEETLRWVDRLLSLNVEVTEVRFALTQLARFTGDRYRDLPESKRLQVVRWLERQGARSEDILLLTTGGDDNSHNRSQIFGESLPFGLKIVSSGR